MFEVAPDGTAYAVHGDGPPVVLIHGLGLSQRLWDAHLPAFAAHRVLTYDLHGHGNSAPIATEFSLTVFAEQLSKLMDHVGMAHAHIVGFSIGGMINRRFALDYPEKVLSLAILNSPHDRGEEAQAHVETRARSARDQGAFATFDAALQRWFTPAYLQQGTGPEAVRNWRTQVDDESYAQTAWVLAHGVRELTGRHEQITCPTIVMTCENDSGSTPAMSMDIAAEIPGAETIIIPRLQHLGLMEESSQFTHPLIDFLAKQNVRG